MIFEEGDGLRGYRTAAREWLGRQGFARREPGRREYDFSLDGAIAAARAWQRRKFEAGYAAIGWPLPYGGGHGSLEAQVFAEEEDCFDTPNTNVFDIGLGMAGPTLLAHGSEVDRRRLLPRIACGDDIWCQLFSEPGAGSDLAGISLRASLEPAKGGWVLNGRKVWTSYAQFASHGLLLARSDTRLPKHRGLTYFWLDMDLPGIAVRPIRQMTGRAEFNEVFFDDVRVPDLCRLGPVNGGWGVAMTTLMHERNFGEARAVDFTRVIAMAAQRTIGGVRADRDGGVRRRVADLWIEAEGLRLEVLLARSLLARGQQPGPEFSVAKLVGARQQRRMVELEAELSGALRLEPDDPAVEEWLYLPRSRLAGGSDEIMANIIAERVLGLPPEPRVDKDGPFRPAADI